MTVAAAEDVAGDPGTGPPLQGLAALCEHHLLQPVPGGRFRMYEAIRQFAAMRLAGTGQTAAVETRHSAYVLRTVEEAEPGLTGSEQRRWMDQLETIRDDARAVLTRAMRDGGAVTAIQVAGAVWRFWYWRGYLAEGHGWLERALAAVRSEPDDDVGVAHLARAPTAWAH